MGDFISKILMQLLFYPLLLMIIGAVTVSSFDGAGETFILIMDAILLGIVLVWIFAFKAYLLIIPVVFIIQCVEQRKTGLSSKWMGFNFVLWVFLGLIVYI